MTEEPIVQKVAPARVPATASDRIRASISDGFLFLPIILLDRSIGSLTESQALVFAYFLVSQHLGWIYNVLFHGYRGQTLGKSLRNIEVVQASDGAPLGYRRAFLRDSPYVVMCLICSVAWTYSNVAWWGGWQTDTGDEVVNKIYSAASWFSIGWCLLEVASFSLHPQRRAIHDLIAGSIVVNKQRHG